MLTFLNDNRYLILIACIVTRTLVLTCMSFYRYLDDDKSDLKQENGILACLNLHGYLAVDMSEWLQVPLDAEMLELLKVPWC